LGKGFLRRSFDRLRMNAHHLQHADAIGHRQKVVRIWLGV